MIDGIFFKSLSNSNALYSDTHNIEKAMSFIRCNKEKNYTLITHNSDHCVDQISIPENIKVWYAQNVNFKHPKLKPLPIGLENEYWHPEKRKILFSSKSVARNKKSFAQFNPDTFPKERNHVIQLIKNGTIKADIFFCKNGQNFMQYVNNLKTYTFCLCPRGNGIDTHRIWEAIYAGCIPVVKKHITHIFEYELPIIFVDEWSQATEEYLQNKIKEINFESFDSPILSRKYWKNKICNT